MTDERDDLENLTTSSYRVHDCLGKNCTPRGSRAVLDHLDDLIWAKGLQGTVEVIGTSCRDRCDYGPSVNVYPGPVQYANIDPAAMDAIVEQHLQGGQPVSRLVFRGVPRRHDEL